MSTWVERDASTGEVLLCVQSGVRPAAPKRVLRLSRKEALVLAGRLVVACDEDAERIVEGVSGAQQVLEKGKRVAKVGGELVDALNKLIR